MVKTKRLLENKSCSAIYIDPKQILKLIPKIIDLILSPSPNRHMDFHQRSARLSSLDLTSRGQLCLLRPISVLVLKIKTVYHKSWYWSCLLRPKLFQSWSPSCLVRPILLTFHLSLECKKLVSQISCYTYYHFFGSVLFTDFRPPLPPPPPSSKLPKTCDWSSTLPETCDWLILCTGRCF